MSEPRKKLLLVAPPTKPVPEMTDAEIDEFADRMFEQAQAATGQPVTKRPG